MKSAFSNGGAGVKVAQLLAMAAAMDNVAGPMAMLPGGKPAFKVKKGNKYAGMKAFSGKQETERRARQIAAGKLKLKE